MKRLERVATGLLIAGMMFLSVASSQIKIRVGPEHHKRHPVVYHHRERARVRVVVPVRHHVERPVSKHRDGDGHGDH